MLMQRTKSNTALLKRCITRIQELKVDYRDSAILGRIEKEMALYDMISIVEGLPLTVKAKAEMIGMTDRKYQYARRVVRDYKTRDELLEKMEKEGIFSISNYKTKKVITGRNLSDDIREVMRKYDITYATPEFVQIVMRMYNKVKQENIEHGTHLNRDSYLANTPCIVCGSTEITNRHYVHMGVKYNLCTECFEHDRKPKDVDIIKFLHTYADDLYREYIKVLEMV